MFRASTSLARASSRFLPNCAEFSISMRVTTSAPDLVMAATILSCWRWRFSALAAPRASQPPRDGDRVAVAVRVERAAGELVARGGEVVQHVEGGDLEVASDGRRSVRAGGGAEARRLDCLRVGGGQVGQRLELPGAVGVAEHHVGLEAHRCADADGVRRGQVRQHLGLGGGVLEEVGGGAVVELDAAGGVRGDGGGVRRRNRTPRRRWAAPAGWCRRPGRFRRTGSASSCRSPSRDPAGSAACLRGTRGRLPRPGGQSRWP